MISFFLFLISTLCLWNVLSKLCSLKLILRTIRNLLLVPFIALARNVLVLLSRNNLHNFPTPSLTFYPILVRNMTTCYIFGDFNLDVLKINENKFISEYVDTLISHGFLQLITKPTRVSANSATLIDHILTNSLADSFDSYILCHHISDHFPIIHNLNLRKNKPKQLKLKTRNFSQINVNRFKSAIQNYNWTMLLMNLIVHSLLILILNVPLTA
jgi:hypothetical protein